MTSPGKKPFLLRLDPALLDALQRWANDDVRSLNAHIDYLLREALRRAGRKPSQPAGVHPEPPPAKTP